MVPRMFLGKAPGEAGPGCGSFAGTTQVEWKEKVLLYVNSTLRVLGKRPGHNLGIGWGEKKWGFGAFLGLFFFSVGKEGSQGNVRERHRLLEMGILR